jgi:hypothetical protein
MEPQQALTEGQTFLRNGQDIAQRSPVNADTLYMWDNQVQAIETFLANTEPMADDDAGLASLRTQLRDVKKQIEMKVLEFELKEEGEELPPEPTEEELIQEMKAYAAEAQELLEGLEKAKIKSLDGLRELDEPRMHLDNFLVETEPLKGKDKEIDAVRERARAIKTALDGTSQEILRAANEADD